MICIIMKFGRGSNESESDLLFLGQPRLAELSEGG